MSAPDILAEIKDELMICGDPADDAWLQRRIESIWSRMETYTARALDCPPGTFVDDWSRIQYVNLPQPMPPACYAQPRGSVFLRYYPVVAIDALVLNGNDADPSKVRFDKKSGKLFSLTGEHAEDLSAQLYQPDTRITYRAGWSTVPFDLYEVVRGAILQQWQQRVAQKAGAPAGATLSTITTADVGTVELSQAGGFGQYVSKSGATGDPLLGPYLSMLEQYIDHRSLIGSERLQVTERIDDSSTSGGGGTGAQRVLVTARAVGGTALPTSPATMPLQSPTANLGGFWNDATQTFSPPTGLYQINASLAVVSNNNNASTTLRLMRNGTEVARAGGTATSGEIASATIAAAVQLVAGDSVQVLMEADRNGMTVDALGSHFSVLGVLP